ncbi:MAG: hypothetical protein AMS23_00540 [Bacteroides sp. SM1_62]|nr:MAG: hypothetical protein AMS26_01135 [Bacteroides sp. SM23_62]KPL26726.1 MAG: hypothetical protein AMS23_00540 [Bacteroides sp. SM1_62]
MVNTPKKSKKNSDFVEKSSVLAGKVLEKIRGGVSDAYEAGVKALDELANSAQNYLEKYEDSREMKRLSSERRELTKELGIRVYSNNKSKKTSIENLFTDKEIGVLVERIEVLNKEIVKLGKKIDQYEK